MILLALDPGLTTGYAVLNLDGPVLRLTSTAIQPAGILVPAQAGMPGQRLLLRQWLTWIVPHVHEVAIEGEIQAADVPSMIETIKVREIIDDTLTQLGRLPTYYAPSTVKATVKRLSGSQDKGLPTKAQLRKLMAPLLNITWPLGVDHVSDAICVGITHAHKTHHWTPTGYQPHVKSKVPAGFLDRLHERYEHALGGCKDT